MPVFVACIIFMHGYVKSCSGPSSSHSEKSQCLNNIGKFREKEFTLQARAHVSCVESVMNMIWELVVSKLGWSCSNLGLLNSFAVVCDPSV